MTWKDRMYAGIGQYLREKKGLDVVEVLYIDEDVSVYSYGGCDTCGPEYNKDFNLSIYYTDSKGKSGSFYYDGTFISFIDEIT